LNRGLTKSALMQQLSVGKGGKSQGIEKQKKVNRQKCPHFKKFGS